MKIGPCFTKVTQDKYQKKAILACPFRSETEEGPSVTFVKED